MNKNINKILESLQDLDAFSDELERLEGEEYKKGLWDSTRPYGDVYNSGINFKEVILEECCKDLNFDRYLDCYGISNVEDLNNFIIFVNAWNEKYKKTYFCIDFNLPAIFHYSKSLGLNGYNDAFIQEKTGITEEIQHSDDSHSVFDHNYACIIIASEWVKSILKGENVEYKKIPCTALDFSKVWDCKDVFLQKMPFRMELVEPDSENVDKNYIALSRTNTVHCLDRVIGGENEYFVFNDLNKKNDACNSYKLSITLSDRTGSNFYTYFPETLYRSHSLANNDDRYGDLTFFIPDFKYFKKFPNGLNLILDNKATLHFIVLNDKNLGNISKCLQNVFINSTSNEGNFVKIRFFISNYENTEEDEVAFYYKECAKVFSGFRKWVETNCKNISMDQIEVLSASSRYFYFQENLSYTQDQNFNPLNFDYYSYQGNFSSYGSVYQSYYTTVVNNKSANQYTEFIKNHDTIKNIVNDSIDNDLEMYEKMSKICFGLIRNYIIPYIGGVDAVRDFEIEWQKRTGSSIYELGHDKNFISKSLNYLKQNGVDLLSLSKYFYSNDLCRNGIFRDWCFTNNLTPYLITKDKRLIGTIYYLIATCIKERCDTFISDEETHDYESKETLIKKEDASKNVSYDQILYNLNAIVSSLNIASLKNIEKLYGVQFR